MFFYVKFSNKMFVSYRFSIQHQSVFSNLLNMMCFEQKVSVVLLGLCLIVLNHKCWRTQNLVTLRAACVWCWFWMSVIRECLWRLSRVLVDISSKLKCQYIWKNLGRGIADIPLWVPYSPLRRQNQSRTKQYKVELKYKRACRCPWENGNYWKG